MRRSREMSNDEDMVLHMARIEALLDQSGSLRLRPTQTVTGRRSPPSAAACLESAGLDLLASGRFSGVRSRSITREVIAWRCRSIRS